MNNIISLEDVFNSYYECRKNKRNTVNAIKFEIDYENNLIELWRELNECKYEIGRSIAFVTKYPKPREIFAAEFRDRIVHHLLIRYIKDEFYKEFIENSFSCTEGKGVLSGVMKFSSLLYEFTEGYTRNDCYIFKSDIKSFFMNINKDILFDIYTNTLMKADLNIDLKNILSIIGNKIIYNRPELNCVIKGNPKDWDLLGVGKSLFTLDGSKGLPIGNLTSQYFANLYMTPFDKFVTGYLGFKNYCRYVDDFILLTRDKEHILKVLPDIRDFLYDKLRLTLHPNKLYLQHYTKGARFIGSVIKPGYIVTSNRGIYNFISRLEKFESGEYINLEELRSSINSYLGLMSHCNNYSKRSRVINCDFINRLSRYIRVNKDLTKVDLITKDKIVKLK